MLKKHYHWIVCLACTMLVFCNLGLCSTILTVYLPFIETNGITGAMGSAIITVRCLSSFAATFLVSFFFKRFSLRLGVFIATLTGALGYLVFSIGGSIFIYYIGAFLFGVAYCFGSMIPGSLIISNWFHSKKGLALGICSTGSGFSTMIFSPVMTSMIQNHGLRPAFIFQVCFIALCGLVIFLLVRDTPEKMGLVPYGELTLSKETRYSERTGEPSRFEYLLLGIMMLVMGGASIGYSTHLTILSTTSGYAAATAASAISVYGVMLIFGKLVFGQISDKLKAKKTSVIFLCVFIIGCMSVLFMDGKAYLPLYAIPILLGLGSPVFTIGPSLWAADLAPKEYYAKLLQWLLIFYNLGGIVFTTLPGIIADHTGEYKSSFLLFGVMVAVTVFILLYSYIRASKHTK